MTRGALAVTVAAMPLYVVRWRVGPIPTTLLESLVLVTVALYLLTLLWHRGPLPRWTCLEIPIGLFLLAGVIGIFVAPDHRGAVGIFRAYLVEPIAVFYVAVAVLDSEASIRSLLATWAAGALLFAAYDIVFFLKVLMFGNFDADNAPAAFYINANSVALFLEPLIGLSAGFALFARGRTRWIGAGLLVVLITAQLMTLSRGGLLALAVLLLLAIATTGRIRYRIALLAAAVIGAITVLNLPFLGTRIAKAFDPSYGTAFVRVRIWSATLRMLQDHPIFGAGINAYESTMAPYRISDPHLVPEPYPHNIFLTTWTELGVLGLAAFTYILGFLIVRPWLVLKRAAGIYRPLLWGVGAGLAMLTTHGIVDSPYWKNDLSLEFWILAALEIAAIDLVRRGQAVAPTAGDVLPEPK